MEQSAVELLAKKLLKKYQLKIDDYPEFAEAKQMEKEQIINAYQSNTWREPENGEQYYNETFKSE